MTRKIVKIEDHAIDVVSELSLDPVGGGHMGRISASNSHATYHRLTGGYRGYAMATTYHVEFLCTPNHGYVSYGGYSRYQPGYTWSGEIEVRSGLKLRDSSPEINTLVPTKLGCAGMHGDVTCTVTLVAKTRYKQIRENLTSEETTRMAEATMAFSIEM